MENEKIKIILDTDPGDDIDDALAIALGLSSKEVEFVGITTVFKNTNDRARLVKKLVSGAGYDIPVYAGHCGGVKEPTDPYSGYPAQIMCDDGHYHMCQFTPDLLDAKYAPENDSEGFNGDAAIDFIIDSCYKYGKELTVLAIGPFTNIGKVIEKDPDALNHAGRVVIMGGAFSFTDPEWNIYCDVHAASLLFSGAVKNLTCIGLDVTLKTRLTQEEVDVIHNYKGKDYAEYASKLVDIWRMRNNGARPLLHDPLALYYCINPSVIELEERDIMAITSGEGRGLTVDLNPWDRFKREGMKYATVKVAKTVDRDAFVKDFISRIFG